jgi:hypothetical protein
MKLMMDIFAEKFLVTITKILKILCAILNVHMDFILLDVAYVHLIAVMDGLMTVHFVEKQDPVRLIKTIVELCVTTNAQMVITGFLMYVGKGVLLVI